MTRFKQRIKSMLYFYEIEFPKEFENGNGRWSKRFIVWLKNIQFQNSTRTDSLQLCIKEAEQQRLILVEATKNKDFINFLPIVGACLRPELYLTLDNTVFYLYIGTDYRSAMPLGFPRNPPAEE